MDIFVLVHAILYFCIVIGGFVISISIGVTRSKINDICILYADFEKSDDTGIAYYVHSSAVSNCDFPVYFSVFAFILYGLLAGAANVFILVKKSNSEWGSSFMCVVPFIAINALVTLVTFIMACMISVGFKQFCDQIEEQGFKSCALIENVQWLKDIEDDHTYRSMSAAEVCAWICFLLWAIQTGLYVFKFIRSRRVSRQRNTETTANKPKETEPTSHPVF